MVFAETSDQFTNLYHLFRIQSYHRFIKNQNFRISKNCLCQSYSLPVPFGKISNQTFSHISNPGHLHHLLYLFFPFCSFNLFQICCKLQIFFYSHINIQRRLFRKISDTSLYFFRLFQNIHTVDQNCAFRRSKITGHNIHCGGFSCTIRSEKSVNLSLIHMKGKMIHRKMISIPLHQILHFNHFSDLLYISKILLPDVETIPLSYISYKKSVMNFQKKCDDSVKPTIVQGLSCNIKTASGRNITYTHISSWCSFSFKQFLL